MIPFFIYYSMFGFQRIGDLIWAACDSRAKGFLLGGTAGRTTLAGEGLQHQDGQSLLNALAFPTVRAYDPAFAYETTMIVLDGMKRMYEDLEDAIYYITVQNENYRHPPMPQGVEEGIIRGIYKLSTTDAGSKRPKVQLFGSGAILREAQRAAEILAERYQISSNLWSVTSYTELARDAQAIERWNMLHPTEKRRASYIEQVLAGESGPFISSSDYVRALAEQISQFVPGGLFSLGTDGFGRSETRPHLRRFFEVDAEAITVAALYQLSKLGQAEPKCVASAIKQLGVDPEKVDPTKA
jgi:pyruvate dehydrogenase E1 component